MSSRPYVRAMKSIEECIIEVSDLALQYHIDEKDPKILEMAIQLQRNSILSHAFLINPKNEGPGAIEAIAMQLGMIDPQDFNSTPNLLSAIEDLTDTIKER